MNSVKVRFGSMDSPNSSSVPTVPVSNQSHIDFIASSLFSYPKSSPIPVNSFFDEVFDKALHSASGDESVQDRLFDRTLELSSIFIDSAKRCFRRRASAHNSNSWFLPPELTIKAFSMFDTKSLIQAATCCTMFKKCAMDPLCYSHIDLSTYADDEVVSTMINRAGKELRSLKLGLVNRPAEPDSTPFLFSAYCLDWLAYDFIGSYLRSLRLYNLGAMNYGYFLRDAMSFCSNITDLRLVGLRNTSEELFKSLTGKCRFIEHLLLETYLCYEMGSSLVEFVISCPNLTSLTLIRFGLTDEMAQILVESCHKLTYLNLSGSFLITGRFLRNLALSCQESPLKTLILRSCRELQEKEILEFCNSLLTGNFKSIQHIDVSSRLGIVTHTERIYRNVKLPLDRLKEVRSDVTFVAEFPLTSTAKCYCVCDEEEMRLIGIMNAEYNEFELRLVEDNEYNLRMLEIMEAGDEDLVIRHQACEADEEYQLWLMKVMEADVEQVDDEEDSLDEGEYMATDGN